MLYHLTTLLASPWPPDGQAYTDIQLIIRFIPAYLSTLFNYQQLNVAYQLLEVLQEHGIASNDIQKLQNAGFHTIESVAHATTRKLCDVKGISEAKVQKLKDITKQLVPMDFMTAADALENRKSLVTLTTGSIELDKLLEGGTYVYVCSKRFVA